MQKATPHHTQDHPVFKNTHNEGQRTTEHRPVEEERLKNSRKKMLEPCSKEDSTTPPETF